MQSHQKLSVVFYLANYVILSMPLNPYYGTHAQIVCPNHCNAVLSENPLNYNDWSPSIIAAQWRIAFFFFLFPGYDIFAEAQYDIVTRIKQLLTLEGRNNQGMYTIE